MSLAPSDQDIVSNEPSSSALYKSSSVGIETLMNEWYKLFPKNPYARGTGLVFISALIIVMVLGGSFRYVDGYQHYPLAAREFNSDFEFAGEEFNIKSPLQLGSILFDKLELTPGKKTKKGYSTNAEVLEKILRNRYQPK